MEDLKVYYQMVEDCISRLGVDPVSARGTEEGQWSLVKGSAKVWLDLWHIEKESRAYFQVLSPVLKMTDVPDLRRAELLEELLKINHSLYGVAFTIHNDFLWIKVIREADGMDSNEAMAMMTRVGTYSDEYDDYLRDKYLPPPPPQAPPNSPV
jgi:hypothetical protein